MVYILLAFAAIYSLMWGVGLLLTLRSPDRSLPVPVLGVLGFLGLAAFSSMKTTEAMENPHKLTAEAYTALKEGMGPDNVKALLGEPAPLEKVYDLAGYHISMPKGVNRSLSMKQRHVDRIDASVKLKIVGEPSDANLRRGEGLGSPANLERNGVMGMQIVLLENDNEIRILEGEDWTYEDDMAAEDVAKAIAEAIDGTDAWIATADDEDNPNMLTITPELEANFGTACNEGSCTVQVVPATEAEPVAEGEEAADTDVMNAIRIRSKADGKPAEFRGGDEESYLWIWDEKGVVLDTDFSNADRIIVVAFTKDKLMATVQAGLGIEGPAKKADEG
jgi:hypothetical protein